MSEIETLDERLASLYQAEDRLQPFIMNKPNEEEIRRCGWLKSLHLLKREEKYKRAVRIAKAIIEKQQTILNRIEELESLA